MPEKRFYLDSPLEKGNRVFLKGDEFHHLKVMRIQEREEIELVNGKNQLGIAQVDQLTKREASLTVLEVENHPAPKRQKVLIQAYLRPKNLDLVLEKGTELGATAFWLFPGQLSEKKNLSLERLRNLTIAAMKQCGRLDLPFIEVKPPLLSWSTPPPQSAFFGDLRATTYLSHTSIDSYVFIGPEKGFSPEEEHLLRSWAMGVRLHENILRAETAALCALSII